MWKTINDIPQGALLNKRQRLENLYYIVDKNGKTIPFNLNWAQLDLFSNFWYQMLVLKARQLGVTTFFAISFLDDCFWCNNISAGIIADKKESAEQIFKGKVKYAYDRMPEWTRSINSATNDRVGELAFRNGSSYRVSTGFRSGTNQRLLISEFGKICAKSPDVAKEIVTGSLNTVSRDQIIAIESTAEGREGYFYDFAKRAEQLQLEGRNLSPMEMRFFFFPWYLEPSYREQNIEVIVAKETNEYLDKIELERQRKIDEEQRIWYELKQRTLHEAMKSEYPSTPKEAFESANQGHYYAEQLLKLRSNGRICRVPHQEYSLVHTSWDLGRDDYTAIWCFQLNPAGEIQLIDYYENRDEAPKHYVDWLLSRKYTFGTHILPHDAKNKAIVTNTDYKSVIEPILPGKIYVHELAETGNYVFNGITAVRSILNRCVFDAEKCAKGIKHLESYRKIWDDRLGCYKNTPFHDSASHASDAFRYLATGLNKIEDNKGNPEDDGKALRAYFG